MPEGTRMPSRSFGSTAIALAFAVAGCSNQPTASQQQLEDFEPPVVGVRGDVIPRAQARFARLDKNDDGFVAADEFPARRADRFRQLDIDRDGKLSRSEMVEGALKRFDALDVNKDGQVTPQERPAGRN